MNWFNLFFPARCRQKLNAAPDILVPAEGWAPISQDTQAAINELSRVVRNNPDMVEIYLALGNLYRSHGEIERAVQIRHNLIVRPGLDDRFKGRAWYELGRDYKRGGFVDRAMHAFEEARTFLGDCDEIIHQIAQLAAESGDFERAAKCFGWLDNTIAQAHYLVRLAEEARARNDRPTAEKWLRKGLKVYPGSVEAWLFMLRQSVQQHKWTEVSKLFHTALQTVPSPIRFLLLEVLEEEADGPPPAGERPSSRQDAPPTLDETAASDFDNNLCDAILPLLEGESQDILLQYYGARLLVRCNRLDEAAAWMEKVQVLKPDFWALKLELLALSLPEQTLSPAFRTNLEYFIRHAREVSRFFCRSCGLKRPQAFFVCHRCQSWHSIAFRFTLHE